MSNRKHKGWYRLTRTTAIFSVVAVISDYVAISSLVEEEPAISTASDPHEPNQGDIRTNSIGMKLVYIPAGSFTMDSNHSTVQLPREYEGMSLFFVDPNPQHQVRISKGFWIGQTEVTQSQWQAVMKNTFSQQRDKANAS